MCVPEVTSFQKTQGSAKVSFEMEMRFLPHFKDLSSLIFLDIDECAAKNPCRFNHKCNNTEGSFLCEQKICEKGYSLNLETGKCDDINECLTQICDHNLQCINTPGSFSCECEYGYRKDPNHSKSCRDIDECEEHPGLCDHKCFNTWGGYRCSCNRGFKLNSDNTTCSDVDECKRNGKALCIGTCKNTEGSYRCGCPRGFHLDGGRYCVGKIAKVLKKAF